MYSKAHSNPPPAAGAWCTAQTKQSSDGSSGEAACSGCSPTQVNQPVQGKEHAPMGALTSSSAGTLHLLPFPSPSLLGSSHMFIH